MATEHFKLTLLTAGQAQKELTANDMAARIENALAHSIDLDFTGGDITLTTDEFTTRFRFVCTNLGADQQLTVPDDVSGESNPNSASRFFAVTNPSSDFTVTVTQGSGAIEVLPGETALLYADGTDITALADVGGDQPNSLGGFFKGSPGADELFFFHIADKAFTLPAGLPDSQGYALTAPDSDYDIDIQVNGSSVGTMTISAAANAATFSAASDVDVSPGDRVQMIGQTTPDGSIENIGWTLAAVRNRSA